MGTVPDGIHEEGEEVTFTGRRVPCPNCDGATGVPLPQGSRIVDAVDAADGTSPTRCPVCDTQFDVPYTLDSDE
jgi:hypothetical protein